jgi:hypothetical protein
VTRHATHSWLLLLPLLLSLCTPGCRRGEEATPEVAAPSPAPPPPREVAPPAALVNDEAIPEALVSRVARRTGWSRERTIQVLVDATLVIQEAARMKQRCADPAAPDLCAKELLEALYSDENLCKAIPESEVDMGYQELFDKDWPVEAYAGWIAEIRCCGGDWGDCDTPAAAACRQGLERWGPPFEALTTAWRGGTPVEDAIRRIFPEESPVLVSDFFFTYWPESDPEDQPKLDSWDPLMLSELVSLPVGAVSNPLRSTMGLHVFRLDRFKPARLKDDPEVRIKIRTRICEGRVAQVRDRYVRDLRAGASIRIPEQE